MILYLASTSAGKLREFRGGARAHGISVEPLPGIQKLPPCIEDGRTFEENARKKATYFSQYVDGLVFADDSGLSVEALGGAPGIYSARFAGEGANDEANNRKLLADLRRLVSEGRLQGSGAATPKAWSASYFCAIALAERGRVLSVFEGQADGVIIDPPRGEGGFGYDPLFYDPSLAKTFAELNSEEKFLVSHRGKAFRRLLEFLESR